MKATREGRRFILAACLIGLAAVNTGNNLIYLILSLMVSFVLLSFAVLRFTLPGLSARMVIRHPVFAGDPASACLMLENASGRIPAYSVHMTLNDRRISAAPAYCAVVPPGGHDEACREIAFRRRGRYDTVACELSSSFPFALFKRRRKVDCLAGITVYPGLRDVSGIDLSTGKVGGPARLAGWSDELHSLREYRAGDDVRNIHWKASAKSDALIVREFAGHDAARITLVLDNLRDQGAGRSGSPAAEDSEEVFEKAVSLAASLARHFLDEGYMVRLVSCRSAVPFGTGREQFLAILDSLAVIGIEDIRTEPLPSGADSDLLVISRRRGGLPPGGGTGGVVIYASDL